jgi:hypothetical protein
VQCGVWSTACRQAGAGARRETVKHEKQEEQDDVERGLRVQHGTASSLDWTATTAHGRLQMLRSLAVANGTVCTHTEVRVMAPVRP